MKRKLFISIVGAVAIAVATVTISATNTNSPESDLLSANLEVLAQTESGGDECSHGSGSPIYNYLYNNCYYDGYKCSQCGQTILYGGTARCLAR